MNMPHNETFYWIALFAVLAALINGLGIFIITGTGIGP